MNKNLPNVYAVPITKKMNNNKETYKSFDKEEERSHSVTMDEINKIFNDKTHVYKTKVQITTDKGTEIVEVVGLVKNTILTLTGQSINIQDILDIKKV